MNCCLTELKNVTIYYITHHIHQTFILEVLSVLFKYSLILNRRQCLGTVLAPYVVVGISNGAYF